MTKKETASLLALLKEYYPRDISNSDLKTRVAAWHYILSDYSYDIAKAGVMAFVAADTKGFPPAPGQIIDQISKITRSEEDENDLAAWDEVRKAASKASMSLASCRIGDRRTSAERLFSALPEDIRAVVHSPEQLAEWGKLPESTLNSVIQSNFLRSYKARRERQREFKKLPQKVQELSRNIAGLLGSLDEKQQISDGTEGQ